MRFWSVLDTLWNTGDAQQFSELFATDSRFEFVDREHVLSGRSAIYEHFRRQFPQTAPDIRHRTTVTAVHEVAPGVWAVDGRVRILRVNEAEGDAAVLRVFAIFGIMVPSGDQWILGALKAYELPR